MKTDKKDKELDIAYFLSFCIEQYKNKHQMSGEEVATLFERYGVLPYLEDNFEVLHTQSHQWLMDEIEELIDRRKSEAKNDTLSRQYRTGEEA